MDFLVVVKTLLKVEIMLLPMRPEQSRANVTSTTSHHWCVYNEAGLSKLW